VVGFCFLDLASNYVPPEPLVKWLEAGDKPIYIGFGSLVRSIDLALFLIHTRFNLI
jgi:sterol 3beta-glucosyltransferase